MKTKQKYFCMKLLALITGLLLSLGLVFGNGMFRFWKASAADVDILTLEEVDEWDTNGYKIEAQAGQVTFNSEKGDFEAGTYDYDYVMTITTKTEFGWAENDPDRTWLIRNDGARRAKFTLTSHLNGVDVPIITEGKMAFSGYGSSTFTTKSSNSATCAFKSSRQGGLFIEAGAPAVGEAYITVTPKSGYKIPEDEGNVDEGKEIGGTLRLLVKAVVKPNIPVTLTSAEKDKNGKENGVWLNGIDVPEATEEWVHIERFSGLDDFFDNIYFLANENGETPSSIEAAAIEGKSFNALMKQQGSEVTYFVVHERSDHLEIERKIGEQGAYLQDTGSEVNFEKGDSILLKKGMKLPGHDGNGGWVTMERGFSYLELLRDQMFTFDGTKWSADLLGATVSFKENTASVDVDGDIQLTATVSAGSLVPAENKALTWTSDHENIATVTEQGVVHGVAAGTCTITVTTGTGDHAECTVTVLAADTVTKVTLNAATMNLNVGGTRQLTATVVGGSQASQEVEWESDNESIATVSDSGLVTGVAAGKAIITVKSKKDPTEFTTCQVTVRASASQNDPGTDNNDPGAEENPSGAPEESGDGTKEPGGLSNGAIAAIAVSGGVAVSGAIAAGVIIFRKRRLK